MSLGKPYKHWNPSERYDAIVIGSGIGGLCAAALLARVAGNRVLVLEQHYTAGGFTHTFKRPGFEWDVGVHYVGDVNARDRPIRRVFDYLTDGALEWADMGEVYDVVEIADRRYELVRGKEAFRSRLKSYFPEEARAIDRYLAAVERAVHLSTPFFAEKALPSPLQHAIGGLMRWPLLRFVNRTTAAVLADLTDDLDLRGLLSAQWGDYGLPPTESSFLMHAIIVNHYLNGAAYPVGGASRIAETIAPAIAAYGGEVLVRAEVREILVEGSRAVGVRMADGREIRAEKVVSDAGAAVTLGDLLPQHARDERELERMRKLVGASCAHLSLYIGLDRTARDLGLPTANHWIFPSRDHDRNVAAFNREPQAPLPVVYLSFPSAKDPDFERRHPGRATIEAVTFVPYAWFEPWQDSRWGRRDESYGAFKQQFEERLRAAVVTDCPSIAGHIQHVELSTPLSTRHFTAHPHGEIYGLAAAIARFEARELQPRTRIDGLFLTGADVCTAGVAGALMGGVLAGSVILKRNLMPTVLAGHKARRAA